MLFEQARGAAVPRSGLSESSALARAHLLVAVEDREAPVHARAGRARHERAAAPVHADVALVDRVQAVDDRAERGGEHGDRGRGRHDGFARKDEEEPEPARVNKSKTASIEARGGETAVEVRGDRLRALKRAARHDALRDVALRHANVQRARVGALPRHRVRALVARLRSVVLVIRHAHGILEREGQAPAMSRQWNGTVWQVSETVTAVPETSVPWRHCPRGPHASRGVRAAVPAPRRDADATARDSRRRDARARARAARARGGDAAAAVLAASGGLLYPLQRLH